MRSNSLYIDGMTAAVAAGAVERGQSSVRMTMHQPLPRPRRCEATACRVIERPAAAPPSAAVSAKTAERQALTLL